MSDVETQNTPVENEESHSRLGFGRYFKVGCLFLGIIFLVIVGRLLYEGSDYANEMNGPAAYRDKPWEGTISIPDVTRPYSMVFTPVGRTNVIIIRVEGDWAGNARITNGHSIEVPLPQSIGKARTFDWYAQEINGEYVPQVQVEYVPEDVTDGELTIFWKFGYQEYRT
jgi:hypothetical protein